jgi:hypothetical protein
MTAARIRELNDAFRRSFSGGRVLLTRGVSLLDEAEVRALLDAVRRFDAFSGDNDPHREHDFGAFEVNGERYFWKIDYYDPAGEFGSENPADPAVTLRVLTLMLASEY